MACGCQRRGVKGLGDRLRSISAHANSADAAIENIKLLAGRYRDFIRNGQCAEAKRAANSIATYAVTLQAEAPEFCWHFKRGHQLP